MKEKKSRIKAQYVNNNLDFKARNILLLPQKKYIFNMTV